MTRNLLLLLVLVTGFLVAPSLYAMEDTGCNNVNHGCTPTFPPPDIMGYIYPDSSTTGTAGVASTYIHGAINNVIVASDNVPPAMGSLELHNGSGVFDTIYIPTAEYSVASGGGITPTEHAVWYAFPTAGTYYYRYCGDIYNQVVESNEANNCTGWQTVTVTSALPAPASGLAASCNAAGTAATLSWNASSGATGYYVRVDKGGQACPSGWVQPGWSATLCTPNPDWVTGTSVSFPTQSGSTYGWGVHSANGSGYAAYVTGSNFSCTAVQCSDGIDNDSDGTIDLSDPGCTGPTDTTESPNPPTVPVVDLTANPTSVVSGNSSTLSWTSSGATSCSGTGFSTGGATSGSVSTGVLTTNSNYQVSCTGPGGTGNDTASVSVTNPTADITASPDRVNTGGSASLTWTTSQCTAAVLTRNGAAFSTALSGTNVAATNITAQTTFRLVCDGGTATDTVIVNLVPTFEEF